MIRAQREAAAEHLSVCAYAPLPCCDHSEDKNHVNTYTSAHNPPRTHLVAHEVDGVVNVAVLQQEVGVDRPGDYPGLEAAEPLEPRVSRGDGPHGHGVEEVHVLGGRLLSALKRHRSMYVCMHMTRSERQKTNKQKTRKRKKARKRSINKQVQGAAARKKMQTFRYVSFRYVSIWEHSIVPALYVV